MVERCRLQGKMQWVMLSPRNQTANSFQQLLQSSKVPSTPVLSQDVIQSATLPVSLSAQENLGSNCNETKLKWSSSVPTQRNENDADLGIMQEPFQGPPCASHGAGALHIRYNTEYCSDCRHIHCLVKSKCQLGDTQLLSRDTNRVFGMVGCEDSLGLSQ